MGWGVREGNGEAVGQSRRVLSAREAGFYRQLISCTGSETCCAAAGAVAALSLLLLPSSVPARACCTRGGS